MIIFVAIVSAAAVALGFAEYLRGKFFIHASKNVNKDKCESLGIDYTELTTGMIIGMATLFEIKKYDNKAQFRKDKNMHFADSNLFDLHLYGFKIKDAQRLRHPIPFSGKLGFFDVQLLISPNRSNN
jgi:hypothetical protein